jgi:hypothetical protein
LCLPLTYGGVGGNSNRYSNQAACYAACGNSVTPSLAACRNDADCRLEPVSCCGTASAFTLAEVVAVRRDKVEPWRTRCGQTAFPCVEHEPIDPMLDVSKNAVARCLSGFCVAADNREVLTH